MQAQSFFVGERGMLVHDNSPVEPVAQPFDSDTRFVMAGDLTPEEPAKIIESLRRPFLLELVDLVLELVQATEDRGHLGRLLAG